MELELSRKVGNQILPKDGKVHVSKFSMENIASQTHPNNKVILEPIEL